jgi:excisionase family DNA binding protein
VRASTRALAIREVMDVRDAAAYLGISPDTLYDYAARAVLPGFKVGNRWRFRKVALDRWMDQESEQQQARAKEALREIG